MASDSSVALSDVTMQVPVAADVPLAAGLASTELAPMAIVVKNLNFDYGILGGHKPVLKGITFSLPRGLWFGAPDQCV